MKYLILIRHAKSSWNDPSADDHDRTLSDRGLRDAPIMAERLADSLNRLGIDLQQIFSSSAVRSQTYAQALSTACGCPLETDRALYTFSSAQLVSAIQEFPDNLNAIAVVGHNPAMTMLANQLSSANLDNMPTSAFLVLKCDITRWQELAVRTNREFSSTKNLDAIEHTILEYNFPKKDNS